MITPDNRIPLDDSDDQDARDQPSQQDIHSNGFDDEVSYEEEDNTADIEGLEQASDAADPSFTLGLDDDE